MNRQEKLERYVCAEIEAVTDDFFGSVIGSRERQLRSDLKARVVARLRQHNTE